MIGQIKDLKSEIIYYPLLVLIVTYSFFSFSEIGFPYLGSDDALNVLMAWKFDIPGTLYCWGQDRGGSFIPLFSHLLISITGIAPVWAVAIIHYALNTLGYFGFSQFFNSKWNRLILAVIWFFPPFYFTSFLQFPMGTQYCIIGISLLFYTSYATQLNFIKKYLLFFLFCITLVAAVWASDLALVNIGCLVIALGYFNIKKNGIYQSIVRIESIIVILSLILGVLFIQYGKEVAVKNDSYSANLVNSLPEIIDAFSIVFTKVYSAFTFTLNNYIMSIYSWLSLVSIILASFILVKNRRRIVTNWFSLFLIINLIAIAGALFTANWVYAYGEMNRRYFVTLYIAIGLLTTYVLDRKTHKGNLLLISLTLTALCGIWSSKHEQISNDLPSKYKSLAVFESIMPAGLVGSYWHTYILDIYNPDQLLATPHDRAGNRNNDIVNEVFSYEDIYLIQNDWFDFFPEVHHEYGYRLEKAGEPFNLDYFTICKYHKALYDSTFTPSQFKYLGEIEQDSNGVEFVQSPDTVNGKLFTTGPYTLLGKGEYRVTFNLKYENLSLYQEEVLGKVDVTANWGKELIAEASIYTNHADSAGYISASTTFTLNEFKRDLEFKIWPQFGENDRLKFYNVHVEQIAL
jgi:hypothetical protein